MPKFPPLLPLLALAAVLAPALPAADCLVYFGSHRSGPGIGFSLAHFDTDTGVLTVPKFLREAWEPAFFVIDRAGRHLYTCNSGKPGTVSVYAIDRATGGLTLLNQMPAGGEDPSYITLDQTERFVLVANYEGGNIAAFALTPDGRIGERTALVQHLGRSVNPKRQAHAYAHSIIVDPTNRFVLVADLGLDRLFVYRFDARTGALAPNDPPYAVVAPGSGPRHVVFHPNGRWVYLVNEMGCTVNGFNWDSATGALAEIQTISTLPADFHGVNNCAEILVHPNGKFLYASNRGHDSLVIFAINAANGRLTPVDYVPTQGRMPRNFAFDPSGRWILVTNHGSDNALVLGVDASTGRLTPAGPPVPVPYPFCERFLPAP